MTRVDEHRATLRAMGAAAWEAYLRENSGLPGPRANLELGRAVAEEAPARILRRWCRLDDEYLAFCGTVGLGRLLAEGDLKAEAELYHSADDGRWRVREAVAMALQRVGDVDQSRMLEVAVRWAMDRSWLVRRAAIAGICEPRLLDVAFLQQGVIDVLDQVTEGLRSAPTEMRQSEQFQILRKALGYCWSVAVAAAPNPGFDRFAHWAAVSDPNIRWIVKENLKKTRIQIADPKRFRELANRLAD